MPRRHRSLALLSGLLLLLCTLPACSPDPPAEPVPQQASVDSLLQGTFWRHQGRAILSAWTEQARTDEGLFHAELSRDWTPQGDTTTVYPGMLARHLFSYSAAFLMSSNPDYLRRARTLRDFLVEHGWDERYGGWYNAVSRAGVAKDTEKDLFMQIYATTGLALHYIATRDSVTKTYLDRSRRFMQDHAWDEVHGGYADVLNRDGSVKHARKDFSPQLAPLSGYLLYLYPATRETTYLRKAERIMDLTLAHMRGPNGWIRERFARDWTFLPSDSKNSHLNVGHNLEVAWLLLRLHALTGTERYRTEGLALTDQLLQHAFHRETGAWRSKLRRTDISSFPKTTTWWVQAYGNMLQLYAYRTTGDDRYLDAFRRGARFWTQHFVDARHGGTVLRANLDGGVADGAKAVRTKTSYHALEHALLCSLYATLWTRGAAATLHYRVEGSRDEAFNPLPIEVRDPAVRRVTVDGMPAPAAPADVLRQLPSGQSSMIDVTVADTTAIP